MFVICQDEQTTLARRERVNTPVLERLRFLTGAYSALPQRQVLWKLDAVMGIVSIAPVGFLIPR